MLPRLFHWIGPAGGLKAHGAPEVSCGFGDFSFAASDYPFNDPMLFLLAFDVAYVRVLLHGILNEEGFNLGDGSLVDLAFGVPEYDEKDDGSTFARIGEGRSVVASDLVGGETFLLETFGRSSDVDRPEAFTCTYRKHVATSLILEVFRLRIAPEVRTTSLDPLTIHIWVEGNSKRAANLE